MSSNASRAPVPFIHDVEEKELTIIVASQSPSTCIDDAELVDKYPSGREAQPAPKAVLDALTPLSPRKNEIRVDLPPISFSQFENYTMDKQSTIVTFTFNLPRSELLSPRSTDPNFQMFCQTGHDVDTMCATYVKPLDPVDPVRQDL